jgi:hypothetical protein
MRMVEVKTSDTGGGGLFVGLYTYVGLWCLSRIYPQMTVITEGERALCVAFHEDGIEMRGRIFQEYSVGVN